MDRNKAIRMIHGRLSKMGYDEEYLRLVLEKMQSDGEIKFASLSASSGRELHLIIRKLFGQKVFVEDKLVIKRIVFEMRNKPEVIPHVYNILGRYGKRSVYQLNGKQSGFVLGYILKN